MLKTGVMLKSCIEANVVEKGHREMTESLLRVPRNKRKRAFKKRKTWFTAKSEYDVLIKAVIRLLLNSHGSSLYKSPQFLKKVTTISMPN